MAPCTGSTTEPAKHGFAILLQTVGRKRSRWRNASYVRLHVSVPAPRSKTVTLSEISPNVFELRSSNELSLGQGTRTAIGPRGFLILHLFGIQPAVDVLPHFIFRETVTFLDEALQLIPTTRDLVQIVVSEVAPLFFDLTLELLPVSFNTIPVHNKTPVSFDA